MSKKNTELKVGDWVGIRMTGINSGNEPAYQIEKIEDNLYYVVQTEASYQHRMKLKKEKLAKL